VIPSIFFHTINTLARFAGEGRVRVNPLRSFEGEEKRNSIRRAYRSLISVDSLLLDRFIRETEIEDLARRDFFKQHQVESHRETFRQVNIGLGELST